MSEASEQAELAPPESIESLTQTVELLTEKLNYALAENQLWRELVAELRELVVREVSQAFPNGKGFNRIRRCMAEPAFLHAEVMKVVARDAASARLKA